MKTAKVMNPRLLEQEFALKEIRKIDLSNQFITVAPHFTVIIVIVIIILRLYLTNISKCFSKLFKSAHILRLTMDKCNQKLYIALTIYKIMCIFSPNNFYTTIVKGCQVLPKIQDSVFRLKIYI